MEQSSVPKRTAQVEGTEALVSSPRSQSQEGSALCPGLCSPSRFHFAHRCKLCLADNLSAGLLWELQGGICWLPKDP